MLHFYEQEGIRAAFTHRDLGQLVVFLARIARFWPERGLASWSAHQVV
jgi:hypothetical protein